MGETATERKKPRVPQEDSLIEKELWNRDEANSPHEERAAHELLRRRILLWKRDAEISRLTSERDTLKASLREAHDWFDSNRPSWGPGTLPTWFVDAGYLMGETGSKE